jgi:hypothetical protein
VIVRADVVNAVRDAMRGGTLYAWAAASPGRRELQGRIPAYALPLPGAGYNVVVRHSHHGGLLASLRGDRFVRPRAAYELTAAWRLSDAGIATPEVIACALYSVNWLEKRSDIVTRELPAGGDFGAILAAGAPQPAQLDAVKALVSMLGSHGVWHPDLNVKNIYVTDIAEPSAYVLDLDRVKFAAPYFAERANARRLTRSIQKVSGGRDMRAVLTAIGVAT